jgi:hypothetical protein
MLEISSDVVLSLHSESVKGFVQKQNSNSMVETFVVLARRRCHRY